MYNKSTGLFHRVWLSCKMWNIFEGESVNTHKNSKSSNSNTWTIFCIFFSCACWYLWFYSSLTACCFSFSFAEFSDFIPINKNGIPVPCSRPYSPLSLETSEEGILFNSKGLNAMRMPISSLSLSPLPVLSIWLQSQNASSEFPLAHLYLSVRVARIRLSGMRTEIYFLTILDAVKSKIMALANLVSDENILPGLYIAVFLLCTYMPSWSSGRVRASKLSDVFSYKGTNPIMRTPSLYLI